MHCNRVARRICPVRIPSCGFDGGSCENGRSAVSTARPAERIKKGEPARIAFPHGQAASHNTGMRTGRSPPHGRRPESRSKRNGIGNKRDASCDAEKRPFGKRRRKRPVRSKGGRQIGYGTTQVFSDALDKGEIECDLRRMEIRAAGLGQARARLRSLARMTGAEELRMVVRRETFARQRGDGSPDRHQQVDGGKQQGYGSTGSHRSRGKCRKFSPNAQFFLPLYHGTAR